MLHCSCPLKLHTTSSRSLTFPKSTVSLICALKFTCLHHLSAVPSRRLTRPTCTTECQHATISVSENAYVTAGPYMQVTTSPKPLIILTGSDLMAKHRSVNRGMPPFASFHSLLVLGFLSSPVRYRFCIKRYSTSNVFSPPVHLYE